jgi:predicted nucleotidyltransferase
MNPVKTISHDELTEMARVMARESGANSVILFGSQARGDADASSDWDFLLVLPDGPWMNSFDAELEIVRQTQRALWDAGFDLSMEIILMSESSFTKGDNVLARVIWREGKTLFGNAVREMQHA